MIPSGWIGQTDPYWWRALGRHHPDDDAPGGNGPVSAYFRNTALELQRYRDPIKTLVKQQDYNGRCRLIARDFGMFTDCRILFPLSRTDWETAKSFFEKIQSRAIDLTKILNEKPIKGDAEITDVGFFKGQGPWLKDRPLFAEVSLGNDVGYFNVAALVMFAAHIPFGKWKLTRSNGIKDLRLARYNESNTPRAVVQGLARGRKEEFVSLMENKKCGSSKRVNRRKQPKKRPSKSGTTSRSPSGQNQSGSPRSSRSRKSKKLPSPVTTSTAET